nr:PREDICTED: uncharacterized protein LOC102351824 [Latimeria chalumnae]|eukprot:XP_006012017.1 PREDICTED: uncharacterized protein LOC102351824 [Latimeria chalumnae]
MQLPQGITVKFQETQDLGLEHLFSAPTLEQPAPGEPRRQEACQRDQEKEAEFNGCECKQEEVILVQEVKKPPGLSPEMKQNHSEFGGGIPPEPFPYLDVLRTKGPAEVHTPSPEAQEEMTFLSEKQGSLIALAWTTRSEDGQTQPTGENDTLELKDQVDWQEPEDLIGDSVSYIREEESVSELGLAEGLNGDAVNENSLQTAEERDQNANPQQPGGSGLRREKAFVHISEMEKEEVVRSLVDLQRRTETWLQKDKERQMLRIQQRLSIARNRKSEEDLLGKKQADGQKHLAGDLETEDHGLRRTIVRERLERVKRERTYVMQSKRERNTSSFRELIEPMVSRHFIREAEPAANTAQSECNWDESRDERGRRARSEEMECCPETSD